MSELDEIRHYYAEELRAVANLQSEAVVKAFAKVPREHFLGPGPWQILDPWYKLNLVSSGYHSTPDADPKHLYHNVLVAIDATRWLNNGEPAFLGFLIDSLDLQQGEEVIHIGSGTGYYSAILADVVGLKGHVTAIEVDPELAERARRNLDDLPHVRVVQGDGGQQDAGPADTILVNAGVTHPQPLWLDSLRIGGRLLLPLTVSTQADTPQWGQLLKVIRQPTGFSARFISEIVIFPCSGARDPDLNDKLKEAFHRRDSKSIRSLRREPHELAETCWLHDESFCLSKLAVT
jgi:protein-L-isoaspartate(D-aspartate) O-methyltransferase